MAVLGTAGCDLGPNAERAAGPCASVAGPVDDAASPASILPLEPGNPFTTPLPRDVPLLPRSEQENYLDELRFLVDQSVRVEQRRFSAALYIVYRNGDVYDSAGRKKASGARFVAPSGPIAELNGGIDGQGWPIAAWMQPDPGERHMAIYNPETGAYGEFIDAEVTGETLNYGWGGYIADVRKSQGTSTQPGAWWGATALGMHFLSTIITEHEVRAAVRRYRAGDFKNAYIPHVLGYEAYRHHPNEWHYPASRTDDTGDVVPEWGVGGDPNRLGNGLGRLRVGGILRLDPEVDVQDEVSGDGTAKGDMLARIIARTLQVHGATMTDQTAGGFVLLAEHVRRTDGGYEANAFSYGTEDAPFYGTTWLAPMLRRALDEKWLQWVNTGRNLEADEGGSAPRGVYRPPNCTVPSLGLEGDNG